MFDWAPRISAGLLNCVDMFVSPSYYVEKLSSYRSAEFGWVYTGVKVNFWGNDDGMTALAMSPSLSIPTHNGGAVTPGVNMALLVRLPDDFSVKFASGVYQGDLQGGDSYEGYDAALSIHKCFYSKVDVYGGVEFSQTTLPDDIGSGYTNLGLDYNFTRNLQMFAGIGFGLKLPGQAWSAPRAFDYNPRVGGVWRF